MSTFEEARAHYEPLAEVWIGEAEDGQERLFVGEIDPDRITGRYGSVLRRLPVKSRGALELIEWIESGPDELNRAMEAELPGALGKTVDILEWYPATPEEREVIA
ncbi:hypothetical protein [Halocatena marina]|uniref:hypothetical protein n=1 Tax=Halocatena marina TaxID=2934937 RepID=UPI002010447E|nr:hypothetical protein [Halocatena marina]